MWSDALEEDEYGEQAEEMQRDKTTAREAGRGQVRYLERIDCALRAYTASRTVDRCLGSEICG